MSQKRCGPGSSITVEFAEAGNIISLRNRNVVSQTADSNNQYLVDLLDRADAEQRALLKYQLLRQAFEANPSLSNKIALFEGRPVVGRLQGEVVVIKARLEEAFAQHLRALAYAVIHCRDSADRACLLCAAPRGQQHSPTCALWPLISNRIAFRMEEEGAAGSSS